MEKYLLQNKKDILNKWFELVLTTYPEETAKFLRRNKDQFENPVGYDLHEGIEGVFDGIIKKSSEEELIPFIDKIVKIRAVQDFPPSQAAVVVFFLKYAVREQLQKEIASKEISLEELFTFEAEVDKLALITFDVYMECYKKLSEIRINEIKDRTYALLQKANMIV